MITLRTTCGWVATIHKSLLCHYSTYYQVAIYGRFKEANSNHFDIELNKVSVKWLVRWLYSRQLPGSGLGIGSRSDELFQLYVFADEKDILALRRDVMTRLVQLGWDYLPYHEIALATNSLPRSAPLYRFLFEWYINHWYPHKDDPCQQGQEYEKLPKEFMHLVMCGLCERAEVLRHGKEPTCVCCHEPCGFHEHKSHDEWRESEFVISFSSQGLELISLVHQHAFVLAMSESLIVLKN